MLDEKIAKGLLERGSEIKKISVHSEVNGIEIFTVYESTYILYILEGKIISIEKTFDYKTISRVERDDELFLECIREIFIVLIKKCNSEKYNEILNSLCEEEIEKYFSKVYVPKNLI